MSLILNLKFEKVSSRAPISWSWKELLSQKELLFLADLKNLLLLDTPTIPKNLSVTANLP